MDYFDYYSSFLAIADYVEVLQSYLRISLLALVSWLFIFVFEAIGLFTIAKREGNKHKWFAFVPFLNDVLLGELGGDGYLFSAKIKKSGLWLALLDFVGSAVSAFLFYCEYIVRGNSEYKDGQYIGTPDEYMWAYNASQYGQYVSMTLELVYTIFLVVVLVAFFRKYYPRNYMIFVISSFFIPITKGALIFAVRKNKGIDYQEYMRQQREAYMRRYQQQQQQFDRNPYDPYNPYHRAGGNPYQSNPYGQPQRPQTPANDIEPFEEFASSKPKKEEAPEQERPVDPNDPDTFFN